MAQYADPDRIAKAQQIIADAQMRGQYGKVVAIDPAGCGCTECIVGEYVPMDAATDDQLLGMILGELANHTGYELAEFHVLDDGRIITPHKGILEV